MIIAIVKVNYMINHCIHLANSSINLLVLPKQVRYPTA